MIIFPNTCHPHSLSASKFLFRIHRALHEICMFLREVAKCALTAKNTLSDHFQSGLSFPSFVRLNRVSSAHTAVAALFLSPACCTLEFAIWRRQMSIRPEAGAR